MAEGTLSARPRSGADAPAEASARSNTAGSQNLQDIFLNDLRRNKVPVTMFLVKRVKLQGIITWFDNFSILLRRDGQSQLVYKHAIATIMPSQEMDIDRFSGRGGGRNAKQLQDVFLGKCRDTDVEVTLFLVNGVPLQGGIVAFDLFCMLLERDGYVQLAYKHAVSTVQPDGPLDLLDDEDDT